MRPRVRVLDYLRQSNRPIQDAWRKARPLRRSMGRTTWPSGQGTRRKARARNWGRPEQAMKWAVEAPKQGAESQERGQLVCWPPQREEGNPVVGFAIDFPLSRVFLWWSSQGESKHTTSFTGLLWAQSIPLFPRHMQDTEKLKKQQQIFGHNSHMPLLTVCSHSSYQHYH